MSRKARAEVEGGLYHVITRGNNRRPIFHSPSDYQKFLSLLEIQKSRLHLVLSRRHILATAATTYVCIFHARGCSLFTAFPI